jgi:hypothetical protein
LIGLEAQQIQDFLVVTAPPDCYTTGVSEDVPIPCLVQAKGRGWTLRRRVPDDIRQIIGKREVWRSLKAKSHAEARRLLPLENAKVEALFAEARRRLTEPALSPATPAQAFSEPTLPEPTEAVVRDAVRHWFHQLERKAEAEDKAILGQQDAETVIDNLRVDQAQLHGPQGDALVAGLVKEVLRTYGFAQPAGDGLVLATGLVQAALIEGVRLDAAVAASYGWPADLSDASIVAQVVTLNAERLKEEAAGTVRWLRPEFQAPEETRRKAVQTEMAVEETTAPGAVAWPKDVPSQFIILRTALTRGPASAQDVSRRFKGAPRGAKMAEMLATLAALGQARPVGDGRYVA